MTDDVRLWLAKREYGDESLVELVYATPEGDRCLVKHLSVQLLRNRDVTAAIDADPEKVDEVRDEETRERYAEAVARVRERHDPDEVV